MQEPMSTLERESDAEVVERLVIRRAKGGEYFAYHTHYTSAGIGSCTMTRFGARPELVIVPPGVEVRRKR